MMEDAAFALLGEADEWTLSHVVRRQAQRYGARNFVRFSSAAGGRELSFAALDSESDRVAQSLAALGAQRGDRVLVMLPNCAEFVLLLIACARVGAVFVPLNTELKGYSLQHQMDNCAARLVFLDVALAGAFGSVTAAASPLAAVVLLGSETTARVPAALSGAPSMGFDAFLARGDGGAQPLCHPRPEDIGCIMYTSGTTGPAKGVLMPHAHLALFSVPSGALQLSERDTYYVCMPLFHANALFIQVAAALVVGASVYCTGRFSPGRWLGDIRDCGATITNALGIMTEMLFKTKRLPDDHVNPLRVILAVPVADWIGDFAQRFGVRVFQGYGMTECNMVAYATADDPVVPGCCGSLRPELFEVKVVDPETDIPVPDGEVGEIVVRPRMANGFMQGYFSMPDKTVEAWRNLWFHTGDAGRLEGGKRLFFIDRIKDRIRRRGENVSAFEVEAAISMLDGVAECAVVGVHAGDAAAEQEIKASVVRGAGSAGAELTPLQVLEHCVANLPRFAVPRFIEFIDALPRTASNKVQKHILRAIGTRDSWDREAEGQSARAGASPHSATEASL
jgi:crotonobetaine/carnitine-CoA ligase